MSRWATNKTTATTHTTAAVIIKELRSRGFDTDIADILAYRET